MAIIHGHVLESENKGPQISAALSLFFFRVAVAPKASGVENCLGPHLLLSFSHSPSTRGVLVPHVEMGLRAFFGTRLYL